MSCEPREDFCISLNNERICHAVLMWGGEQNQHVYYYLSWPEEWICIWVKDYPSEMTYVNK